MRSIEGLTRSELSREWRPFFTLQCVPFFSGLPSKKNKKVMLSILYFCHRHSRKKFGLLEKHKDYALRAQAFHKKEEALRVFYFYLVYVTLIYFSTFILCACVSYLWLNSLGCVGISNLQNSKNEKWYVPCGGPKLHKIMYRHFFFFSP